MSVFEFRDVIAFINAACLGAFPANVLSAGFLHTFSRPNADSH